MGYWKCKKCGGKIRVTLSRVVNTDYNMVILLESV